MNQASPSTSADVPSPAPASPAEDTTDLLAEDLLVEDVSIDGMCGVY